MITSRIIKGKTTDFEPLHIIAHTITSLTLFLLYIYTKENRFFLRIVLNRMREKRLNNSILECLN